MLRKIIEKELKDYYEILSINSTARLDEVKHAYRILAKKYHPDVSREANSSSKFLEVKEAYDALSDIQKREGYDREYSKYFGKNDYSKNFEKTDDFRSAPKIVDQLLKQIRDLSSIRHSEITPETLKEKIIGLQDILSKVKISDVSHNIYLKLSSAVARIALALCEGMINEILDFLLISPEDKLIHYSTSADRMEGVLSWVTSIQENVMTPLESYELNTQTEEFFSLKKGFYSDLEKNLKDAISKGKEAKGNCYIASHVYGDYNSREVIILRYLRDNILNNFSVGRAFIKLYYQISPSIISIFGKYSFCNRLTRKSLDMLIAIIKNWR